MKPSSLVVFLFFLYLWGFVNSMMDLTPEVSQTSEELAASHSPAYEFSGIETPVAVEGSSSKLVSLRRFSDQLMAMLDHSSAGLSSICSSMENGEPGSFLIALLDGTILSVDCKSGIQWSLQTGSALSYSEQAITEIDNSGCFLYPGEDWKLYEYCAGTGLRKLNLTIEEYVHNTPEIRGTEIIVGSKVSTTYLLDAGTGNELYKEQHPSNSPGSTHKFGKKLVSPELKIAKKTRDYIIIVRTDYYLNSSVLGIPNWNMMESRISATYVNNEVPTKAGGDLNFVSPYQKDIPVYCQRQMNNPLMAASGAPMLPSASDFHNNLAAETQHIYKETPGVPHILPETTDGNQNVQSPAELYFHVAADSSKDANECSSGNCIMFKPFDSEVSYEVASLQPRSSRLENLSFENVLDTSNDSFMLADNSFKNLGSQWSIQTLLVEAFRLGLQIFVSLSLIIILVMYFWKAKEPSNYVKKLTSRGRVSISSKKKKTRKPVNMKKSTVTTIKDKEVADQHNIGTNLNSNIENSDINLLNLLRYNGVGEGRWVGKLFVSNTEIGRGSNGTVVFEGIYDGRIVAVKRLLRAHHDVAFKEIQNLIASDRHPNIVRWYGVEQDLDFVYISLERCFSSLNDLIQLSTDYMASSSIKEQKVILPKIKGIDGDIQLWRSNGFPSSQLLKLMRDVVSGVAHLHELGIIHRDLKPQNVLVSDGKILTAKVSDMGISKRLLEDMSSLSHNATGHGSSGWRAPEQLRHGRQSCAVDLFSLGCILFFCMTKGDHPFGSYYERDMNIMNNKVDLFLVDHIPEAVDLLMKLLNSEPKMRPNAVQVLHHPLFWSSETRLSFLRDISDRIESEDRDHESELLRALENASSAAFGGKWGDKLDTVFINDMGRFRKYSFDSMRDLLRVIRNKQNHYRELSKELKELLGPVPEGFDQYFSARFPKLLIEAYKVICVHCREEDCFRKYFSTSLI